MALSTDDSPANGRGDVGTMGAENVRANDSPGMVAADVTHSELLNELIVGVRRPLDGC